MKELILPSSTLTIKSLKDFVIVGNSIIEVVASEGHVCTEANEELQRVHELLCGINDVSLYRRLHRQGYYWPEMGKEVAELQLARH